MEQHEIVACLVRVPSDSDKADVYRQCVRYGIMATSLHQTWKSYETPSLSVLSSIFQMELAEIHIC